MGKIEAWNEAAQDAATRIVTYVTHYRVTLTGQLFSAASRISFTPKNRIAAFLTEAGFTVDTWLGDWQGSPYTDGSKDIIPIGRLR